MMPWGHFTVAYVPYAIYTLLRKRRLPDMQHTVILLVATQVPDLIDKPLAWSFHILPSGRSLGHSVVFAVPYVLLATVIAWQANRSKIGGLFTFGYLSHIYVDIYPAVTGSQRLLPNLYWPLLPIAPPRQPSFLAHFARIEFTPLTIAKISLLAVAVLLYAAATLRNRRVHKQLIAR